MIRWLLLGIAIGLSIGVLIVGRIKSWNRHFFWRRVVFLWLCILATVVVSLLPLKVNSTANQVSNRDIIFVTDTTQSMNAVDGRGGDEHTRLQNVRDDMKAIASQNIGASMGIFTFSDQANLLLPLTTNMTDVTSAMDTIYTASQYQVVSKIVSYTDLLTQVGDYVKSQNEVDPTRQRIVIMMSDFEIYKNQEQPDQIIGASNNITENGAGFMAILYGQDAGAQMLNMMYDYENSVYIPSYTKYGDYSKYLQVNYKPTFSVPNPTLATQLASSLHGDMIRANQTQNFTPSINKAAKRAGMSTARNPQTQALHQNIFYTVPAVLALLWLFLCDVIKPRWLTVFMFKSVKPPKKETKK